MLENQSLADQVVNTIRKLILDKTLKPGEKINQVKIAEDLNISRGPVREALKLLQNEGLIDYEINKGTFVTTLSEQDAYEIFTMRALLESKGAQLAQLKFQQKDYDALQAIISKLEQALIEKDLESLARYDILFHNTIINASGHSRLIHMHQQLDTQVSAMFLTVDQLAPLKLNSVIEDHQGLIDILKNGSEIEIAEKFSEHYEYTLERLNFKQL